ncbi:MAG: YdcF family protein [Novosphingobium sp.]|nr:YdcF family protein [Novosphingobium sp.]
MFRRAASSIFLVWLLGFFWFAISLPRPVSGGRTDGVIVLTGGEGRIDRGLEVLRNGQAKRLLVSGVAREVRPSEFAAQYEVLPELMACCITLGFESVDTRTNAREAADWLAAHRFKSVRLITTDWHMRRASLEFGRELPGHVVVVRDAVPSRPSLRILFLEYHKLLVRWLLTALGK